VLTFEPQNDGDIDEKESENDNYECRMLLSRAYDMFPDLRPECRPTYIEFRQLAHDVLGHGNDPDPDDEKMVESDGKKHSDLKAQHSQLKELFAMAIANLKQHDVESAAHLEDIYYKRIDN
jgi:hypothetical protein